MQIKKAAFFGQLMFDFENYLYYLLFSPNR